MSKANMKELTQHDTMSDWQSFRGGSKEQQRIAAQAGGAVPKMPKMGDRFLKRPTDAEVARITSGKRPREVSPTPPANEQHSEAHESSGKEESRHMADVNSNKEKSLHSEKIDPAPKKKRKHVSVEPPADPQKSKSFTRKPTSNHFDLAQSALQRATSNSSSSSISSASDSLRRNLAPATSSIPHNLQWHEAFDKASSRKYWYNAAGQTSWTNPSLQSVSAGGNSAWVASKKKKTKKKKKRSAYIDPLM